ncbi:MAG: hypothetical protein K6A42_11320 [Treponema sp.]|nr:hypothetical protein [Treponema sp.]
MKKTFAILAFLILTQGLWAQEAPLLQEGEIKEAAPEISSQEETQESEELPLQEELSVQEELLLQENEIQETASENSFQEENEREEESLEKNASTQEKEWLVQEVFYDPKGGTKIAALKRKLKIAPGKIFKNRQELDDFIVKAKQDLINERLFESVEVNAEEIGEDGEKIAAKINVQTVDSGHFIFMPYPKYDSNEGFEFKVKLKDDNFMGLMSPLSSDVFVQYEQKEGKSDDFVTGASLEYKLPFELGPIQASWNNDLFFKYAFIRAEPEWNLKTGFSFVLPFERVSLRLDLTQGFVRDSDYKVFNDELYWAENAKFSIPIVLERFKKIGDLVYTPAVEIDAKWNLDGINSKNEDMLSPRLIFSHELTLGQVNWVGNFRKGFSVSAKQSMAYNFYLNEMQPGVKLQGTFFNAWKYAGINSRFLLFAESNTYTRFGKYLRGVSDDQYFAGFAKTPNGYATKGAAAIILNFDVPIHFMTVIWEDWGVPFLNFFNCEIQVMPFIDLALAANRVTGRVFDPRDGFYCAGIEVNVFPHKWKSVQIRSSLGLDIGRLFLSDKIDTSWRDEKSGKFELTVGIGLFY